MGNEFDAIGVLSMDETLARAAQIEAAAAKAAQADTEVGSDVASEVGTKAGQEDHSSGDDSDATSVTDDSDSNEQPGSPAPASPPAKRKSTSVPPSSAKKKAVEKSAMKPSPQSTSATAPSAGSTDPSSQAQAPQECEALAAACKLLKELGDGVHDQVKGRALQRLVRDWSQVVTSCRKALRNTSPELKLLLLKCIGQVEKSIVLMKIFNAGKPARMQELEKALKDIVESDAKVSPQFRSLFLHRQIEALFDQSKVNEAVEKIGAFKFSDNTEEHEKMQAAALTIVVRNICPCKPAPGVSDPDVLMKQATEFFKEMDTPQQNILKD